MRRLLVVLLGLMLAAAFPLNALAEDEDLDAAMREAKFMTTEGPNAPPDLIDADDMPVIGDEIGRAHV